MKQGADLRWAPSPPCRCCGDREHVGVYWARMPWRTICPECCPTAHHYDGETGHGFDYELAEQDHVCRYCGVFSRHTDYYDHYDEP